jgi:UDP-N-acetylmuramyl pentapeptide phosphotransferase/UDP-N-acetylglucosamine-1-phosphate transferase
MGDAGSQFIGLFVAYVILKAGTDLNEMLER